MNYLPSNPLASKKAPADGEEPTEDQKHAQYDALSPEQKKKQTYTEWVMQAYNNQYERWMPWIEDQYLYWFGKGDNKASYVTKGLSPPSFSQPILTLTSPRLRYFQDRY